MQLDFGDLAATTTRHAISGFSSHGTRGIIAGAGTWWNSGL